MIFLLVLAAWLNRFILDDAFISFDYSRNLAEGRGLIWNTGERVEGYTNFLWTVLMAVPFRLELDPVICSMILGMIFFVTSLVFAYKLGCSVFGSKQWGLLLPLLLGTNYSFNAFATGGMETQMQAALIIAAAYFVFDFAGSMEASRLKMAGLSLLFGALILTRLDSVIPVFFLESIAVFTIMKMGGSANKPALLSCLILPAAAAAGTWLAWKRVFYGDILPNTFYAKAFQPTSILRGLYYCHEFFLSYWLWPFAFFFAAAFRKFVRVSPLALKISSLVVIVWCFYIIRVGGDFMEFRFFVPVLPFIFLIIIWLMAGFIEQPEIRTAFVILIIAGSVHHGLVFGKALKNTRGIQSIRSLKAVNCKEYQDWSNTGRALASLFDGQDISIATTAAGAIPFYSRLRTIDMCGLNDKWIARRGLIISSRPGHQRIATLDYMIAKEVNLVIGHPRIVPSAFLFNPENPEKTLKYFDIKGDKNKLPPQTEVVEIPINSRVKLLALYLARNSFIDELINSGRFKSTEIFQPQAPPKN